MPPDSPEPQEPNHGVKLAIVGSTTFADATEAQVRQVIGRYLDHLRPGLVISGGAIGVDSWAVAEAQARGIDWREHLPEHRRWAPAGFKARNVLIAKDCTHLLRIHCPKSKTYGSGWTADYAENLHRKVIRVPLPTPAVVNDAEHRAALAHDYDDFSDRPGTFRERLTYDLDHLPEQYIHLYLSLPKTGAAGERVSGTRDTPTPVALEVEALMRDIAATVTTWERIVRETARLSDVAESRQESGVAVGRACRTLTVHLDTLLDLPEHAVWEWDDNAGAAGTPEGSHYQGDATRLDRYAIPRGDARDGAWVSVDRTGAAAGRLIGRLAARCRHTLGMIRLVHHLDVPCPTCGVVALTRESGASEVRCQSCGRGEPQERYAHLVRVLAEEERARMEADDPAV